MSDKYREKAIQILVDEIKLPNLNGKVPDEIMKQYQGVISVLEGILSNEPQFPITVWSPAFNLLVGGAELPGPAAQPVHFHKLNKRVVEAWNNVSNSDETQVKITQQAQIIDANNKKVYP